MSTAITLYELRQKRVELCKTVENLVRTFQRETGVSVTDIKLAYERMPVNVNIVVGVNVDIEI